MAFRVDTRVLMQGVKEPILVIDDPTLVKFEERTVASMGRVGVFTLPDGTKYILDKARIAEWHEYISS